MARTDRLIEVFNEAKARPSGAERDGFLAESCGDDTELKEQVLSLLQAHEGAGEFLGSGPALSPEIEAELARLKPEEVGERIGPYKLREQLGEGGFGVVWVAEQQEPVRRTVALKIIKLGMDTREVVARFEQERQALAMMDHPNIARVLDAGATEHGRPFFVMELVRGIKITEYCDQANLPTAERLALFITVCHAVQHAHQKGIIHRDLKPSNILVTLHDGVPVPKVIDFGVAKATQGRLGDFSIYTQFQQMIGTPLYMSPEQAEMSGLNVDTRTDIYALGVLLYELLTGRTPFDAAVFMKAGHDEMRRIIREEEPQRPSTALDTMAQEKLTSVAHHRASEPPKLIHAIHGDLDWIVMKTLEKDRARRYDTANGLALDIQRHLDNETVVARPPSAGYRFQKLVRRNKLAFAAASAVAAALIIGLGLSTWLFLRERAALKVADENALSAEHQADRAERSRQQAEANAQEAEAARMAEAEQRAEAESQRANAEANFQKARQTVDEYFTTISETTLLEAPGLQPLRKRLLEAALSYYQGFLEQARDNPELQADLAAAHLRLSVIYVSLDRNDDAVAAMLRGLELVDQLVQKRPGDSALPRRLAGFFKISGGFFRKTRPPADPIKAVNMLQRAAGIWEQFARDNPMMVEFQGDLAGIYLLLGALFENGDDFDRCLAYTFQSRAILEKLVRTRPAAAAYQDLLVINYSQSSYPLTRKGRTQESEQLSRQAVSYFENLAQEFPAELSVRRSLARVHIQLADALQNTQPSEAESIYRQAVNLLENLVTESPANAHYRQELYESYNHLTSLLRKAGRDDEAETFAGKALPINEQLVLEFPNMPDYRQDLASRYQTLADRMNESSAEKAEQAQRQALAVQEKLVSDFPDQARFMDQLLQTQKQLLRLLRNGVNSAEAEKLYRDIIAGFEKQEANSPNIRGYWQELARNHNQLGILLRNDGRRQEADVELRKAQELWQHDPDPAIEKARKAAEALPNDVAVHRWQGLIEAYYNAGDWEKCLWAIKKKEQVLAEMNWVFSGWEGFYAAMAHWQLDQQEEALTWFYKSVGWMEDAQESRLRERQAEAAVLMGLPDPAGRSGKASTCLKQGQAYQQQGEMEKAKAAYAQAIRLYETLVADFPMASAYQKKLAELLTKTGRQQEARKLFEGMIAFAQKTLGESDPVLGEMLHNFAEFLLFKENKPDAAAEQDLKALPIRRARQDENLAWTLRNLGYALRLTGKAKEAEPYLRESAAISRKLGDSGPWVIEQLARALSEQGKQAEAETLFRETLAMNRKLLGDEHLEVAASLCSLSFLLRQEGKLTEAESTARETLATRKKLLGDEHTEVAQALHLLAWNLNLLGKSVEAEALSRDETTMWRKLLGNEDPKVAWALGDLTVFLRDQGKMPEAETTIRESLAIRQKQLKEGHPDITATFKLLNDILRAQGKPAETLQ